MNNTAEKLKKDLRGKTAVITGASGGAGRAIAVEFAAYGVKVALAARRDFALDEVAEECRSLGSPEVLTIHTDVTDAESVQLLAEKVNDVFGRIDIWVNNAGVLAAGSFDEMPTEILSQVIRTNLLGYMYGAHAVLPFFKQQQFGVLINNISVGGWFPVPYAVAYSASKFGLRGFSEALRGELTQWPGIHVCDMYPAFLDTPGIQHAANYTGRYLKPAPPVYDPQQLAAAVVKTAVKPRNSVTIGGLSTVLRLSHFLSPLFSAAITAKTIERYLKSADAVPSGSGNLFVPLKYGSGVRGGWDRFKAPSKRKVAAVFLLTCTAGLILKGLVKR